MKELVFIEPGRLEWRERDDWRISDQREALVRPLAVAVCDLDWETIAGRTPFKGPFGFGHEAFAQVIEVGADVTSVSDLLRGMPLVRARVDRRLRDSRKRCADVHVRVR